MIVDLIVNLLMKKGILGDIKQLDTIIDIPQASGSAVKITIKAENVQIKLYKEE